MPATDLPNVGRIAMVSDPQGVPFYVMTPVPPPGAPDATSDVFDRHARQRVNWNELASPDLASSKAFYSRHFGFEFKETMNMGPMGDYSFVAYAGSDLLCYRAAGPAALVARQNEVWDPILQAVEAAIGARFIRAAEVAGDAFLGVVADCVQGEVH